MQTSAVVLADSINEHNDRLTTLQVCFPRFILAEFNTHRVMSRNFRSSRAVPVAKLIEEVRTDPFIPSQFTKNQAGMQGGEALTGEAATNAELAWRTSAKVAADHAEWLAKLGVHKQYANRGLEPYMYVYGVISATDWHNFFQLRCHADAQPEFQELAFAINAARAGSRPREIPSHSYSLGLNNTRHEHWHLPYISDEERIKHSCEDLLDMSAARCAWVSYKPFEGGTEDDSEKVKRTLSKLMSTPIHASPFEHQATPGNTHPCNFDGWVQQRHILEECVFTS